MILETYNVENDIKQILPIVKDLIDNSAIFTEKLFNEGVNSEEDESRYDVEVILTNKLDEKLFNDLLSILEGEYGEPEYKFESDFKERYIDGRAKAWALPSDKILKLRESEDAILLSVRDLEMAFLPKHKLFDTKETLQKVSEAILNEDVDDNLILDSYITEVYTREYGNGAFAALGGRYCFEYDNIIEMGNIAGTDNSFIFGYYGKIQSLLSELYGEPSKKDEKYGFGDSSLSVWEVAGKNLCLLYFEEYGDGDFEYKLLLFSTNFESRYLVEDDDWDDDEDYDEDEPNRPDTVPAEAVWNANENEWELGETDEDGTPIGEWKWWLAPKGYLCCHTFYQGDSGDTFSFTRFHEDGTPSRIGNYAGNRPVGNLIWIRSDKPTIEMYPTQAGKNVWKTVSTIRGGYTIEEHYYDKEGDEIQDAYISDSEMSELDEHLGLLDRFIVEKFWEDAIKEADAILEEDIIECDQELIPILHKKALALYKLNNETILDSVDTIASEILDAYTFELWPFLSEFNQARDGLRFAYFVKAKQAMDSKDYDKTEELINNLFEVTSPIDTDDMSPYKKLKQELLKHL